MNRSDWERRSALFDEAVELPADARSAWLSAIALSDPTHLNALKRMLAEFERPPSLHGVAPSVAGLDSNRFEASLDAATSDSLQLQPGNRVGAWELVRKIGEGGMGEVWLASRTDGHYEGNAAIKFLRTGLGRTQIVERFLRERRLLARLSHPGIARLLDAGTYKNEPYLVMEHIEGQSIIDWATRNAHYVAQRVALMLDVCRAIEYAHGQLIVHRDLKPSNVLVNARGEPLLLDFGIAKLIDDEDEEYGTALTRMTGRGFTLGYCAPEQITGEPTGVAADVFSIGVMLFELLTGTLPFKGEHEGRAALEHAIVHTDARLVGRALDEDSNATNARPQDADKARGDLESIVAKSLRKNPADRYPTVAKLADDLDAWLARRPISIRAEDRSYRSRLWLKRNWKFASLGAIAVAAVLVGFGVSLWQRSQALDAAARATKVANYLGELIQSASPDSHGGKWPTVLALLEQSEKDLDREFAEDPKTHALLLKRLADTNDALNRDTVALAQLDKLYSLLSRIESPDSDAAMDARKQYAQLLRRLKRYTESVAVDEVLLPKFAARYGPRSEEYGALMMGTSSAMAGVGRMADAKKRLVDGAAILTQLYPNDLAKRVDLVNDSAVLLTGQAMWREALATLETIEPDLPAFSKLGGQKIRDALIMRRNLEAMRIRVGRYDGVEARLRQIVIDDDALLGKDNVHSAAAINNLRSLACETGRFADCLKLSRELLAIRKRQIGVEPSAVIEAELLLISMQIRLGQVLDPPAAVQFDRIHTEIAKSLKGASADRAELYRVLSDAATSAGMLALADATQQHAREDLVKINNANPERAAQIDRAAALTAFVRGEPKQAVELLEKRFRLYELAGEGDTPRNATLWLQRAVYEIEFDPSAAVVSLTKSRSIFERIGGAAPQFKSLIAYIEARIARNAAPIRAAEDSVDRAFSRPRPVPWRAPLLASL